MIDGTRATRALPSALARRARAIAALTAMLRATLMATLLLGAPAARAAELHVAVAANFLGTLQKLAEPYQAASGNTLSISAGSSGQLLAQIRQGAPFDLFFSADAERPRQLETQGLAVPGSQFTYAVGSLVLWSPRAGVIDGGAAVLQSGQFQRLAIAAPGSAPYGAAAQQVLTSLGLWDRFNRQHKIVVGESITQAWQFAASGNASLAFVALSQVIGAGGHISGSSWLPPQGLYTPLSQDAVILKRTSEGAAAQNFEQWLKSAPQASRILLAAGYRTAP